MACFLIDYENQKGRVLENISTFTSAKDEIILFYSKTSLMMTFDLHMALEETPARKEYIKIEEGKMNALDFQLSSYLGARINSNPDEKYYIISKDTGYDCVCRFWKKKKISVERIENLLQYEEQ